MSVQLEADSIFPILLEVKQGSLESCTLYMMCHQSRSYCIFVCELCYVRKDAERFSPSIEICRGGSRCKKTVALIIVFSLSKMMTNSSNSNDFFPA